jgi:hypothetical protein
MKNTIKALVLAFFISVLFSCGSDDDKKTPEFSKENPLQSYLTTAGFSEVSNEVNAGAYEFGITFIPKVKGQISEVVVKLPDAQTDLRVTIWDAETGTPLRTETIASAAADTQTSKTITPLALTKDHEYMITFNSDDWYNRTKPDESDTTYPITAGNISVTGYAYADGTDQVFPTEFQTDYYAGDLSFVFLRTE